MTTKKIKSNEEINKEIRLICHEGVIDKTFKTYGDMIDWLVSKLSQLFEEKLNLLKKLNRLDRENVEEIITDNELYKQACYFAGHDDYRNIDLSNDLRNLVDQILSLVPEEGEVLARGIIKAYPSGIEIGNKTLSEVNEEIFKYEDKKVQIIIKQIGDGK